MMLMSVWLVRCAQAQEGAVPHVPLVGQPTPLAELEAAWCLPDARVLTHAARLMPG